MKVVTVRRQPQSRTWGVYVDGKLVEGGFFSRYFADACAAGYRPTEPDLGRMFDTAYEDQCAAACGPGL